MTKIDYSPPSYKSPFSDARLRRSAAHIHKLGPRPLYELLREVLRGKDPAAVIDDYCQLSPETVRALGADQFPAQGRIKGYVQ